MSTLRERFRPSPGFTVFMVIGVSLLWSLCGWQLRRRAEAAAERVAYAERLDLPAFDAASPPAEPEFRRVRITGSPDWAHAQRVIGRYMWSQQGEQLIVPVGTGQGSWVWVDVGWVPEDEADAIIAREQAAGSVRTYVGIARPYPETPDAAVPGAPGRWRAVSPGAMASALGIQTPSWLVIDGEGLADDADIPDRVPPISGWRTTPAQRPHGEYAFTWFGLGLTLLLVWGSASLSRATPSLSPPS